MTKLTSLVHLFQHEYGDANGQCIHTSFVTAPFSSSCSNLSLLLPCTIITYGDHCLFFFFLFFSFFVRSNVVVPFPSKCTVQGCAHLPNLMGWRVPTVHENNRHQFTRESEPTTPRATEVPNKTLQILELFCSSLLTPKSLYLFVSQPALFNFIIFLSMILSSSSYSCARVLILHLFHPSLRASRSTEPGWTSGQRTSCIR